MKDRLGVDVYLVAGCVVVDKRLEDDRNAYNERMEKEIARRFGPQAISQIQADVQALYRQKKK